jgi:hypothetical protein
MYDPPLVEQQEPWVKPQINLRSSSFFRIFLGHSPGKKVPKTKKKAGLIKFCEKNHKKKFTLHLRSEILCNLQYFSKTAGFSARNRFIVKE